MAKYRIKDGQVFEPFGKANPITNKSLTDEMVDWYAEKHPEHAEEIFETVKPKEQKTPAAPKTPATPETQKAPADADDTKKA